MHQIVGMRNVSHFIVGGPVTLCTEGQMDLDINTPPGSGRQITSLGSQAGSRSGKVISLFPCSLCLRAHYESRSIVCFWFFLWGVGVAVVILETC